MSFFVRQWGKGPETVVAAADADVDMAPPITPAAIENESRNISFPVAFERIKVGGNGRYLCLHLRDIRKVAIVDVSLAKVTGYISLRSDEAEFAASKNKLVVVDSTNKRISRWNLVSRKMELEKKFTEVGRADRCVMGRDSSGPLLVRTTNNAVDSSGRVQKFHLFDLNTLDPLEVDQQTAGKLTQSIVRGKEDIFVSSNGKEFVIYNFGTIKIEDKGVRVLRNYSEDLSRPAGNGWHVRKNQIYSGGKAVATIPDAKYIIPALDGPFYISLPGVLDRFRGRAQRLPTTSIRPRFHILGETQPITSLERYTFSARFTPEQSMILIPDANVLAMTNQTRDTIELKSLDVAKLMSNSDVDFLIVSSQPTERRLKLEQEFDYQIEVTSKNGGLKYSLDSSPEGMTVDSDGRITWAVPEDLKIASHEVIVSVKDSKNQEVFHKFNLFVPEVAVIAERARMKKRQAEQMKAMTEQNKLAIKEFKAKYEAAKLKSEEPPGLAEFEESPNEVRKWTDSTGEHQIEAKFVKVENRTDLMLIADDGRTRRIPLNRLSSKDVYAAVELELKRTEAADKAKKKTSEVKLDAQTQFEIYRDVNRMVEDFDKLDVEAWYGVVYHPDALKKKKESGELQKGLTEYNKTYLYSNLLKIDLTRARQNKDFLSVRTVSLKKIGDRWYVYLR